MGNIWGKNQSKQILCSCIELAKGNTFCSVGSLRRNLEEEIIGEGVQNYERIGFMYVEVLESQGPRPPSLKGLIESWVWREEVGGKWIV